MMTMNHSGFGVGDFLFYAIKQCTDIHRVCITTDAPVRLPSGEMCSAFTWECLLQSCRQLAAWYAVQKVGVGDRIALYMEDSVAYLLHQVALNSLGAVAVYANGALPLDSAIEYFKRVHVRGVILGLAQQDASHQFDELSGVFIHCHDNIRQPNDEGLPANYPYSHQDDDVVLISHTSGTTGVIKGVVQKHAHLAYGIQQFLRNRPAYSTQPAYCGSHRYLSLLPTAHNSFLAYSMRALLTDTPLRVICDRRPEHIARQIKEWQPSVVISFFMAYQNLVNASVAAESFSSVGYWINTGDAAHQPYIKRITAWGHHCVEGNMAAGSLFLDGLGSSEMGSTFFRLAHSCASKHPLRCVGPVRPGFSAAILSEDGRVLDNYMVGRLGVQGRSVTTGYSGDAVQSAQAQVNG